MIYENNPWNSYFDDLPFDGDERLIARRRLYRINDDIIFILINGSSVCVQKIEWEKNKSLVQCIDQLAIKKVHEITERPNDWTILLTFRIWSLYDLSTMNRMYIILLRRPIDR